MNKYCSSSCVLYKTYVLIASFSTRSQMVAYFERNANEHGHKRYQTSKPAAASSSMAETLQNLEQYSGQMTAKELEEV